MSMKAAQPIAFFHAARTQAAPCNPGQGSLQLSHAGLSETSAADCRTLASQPSASRQPWPPGASSTVRFSSELRAFTCGGWEASSTA